MSSQESGRLGPTIAPLTTVIILNINLLELLTMYKLLINVLLYPAGFMVPLTDPHSPCFLF